MNDRELWGSSMLTHLFPIRPTTANATPQEEDANAKARLGEVQKEMATIQDELQPLLARYEAEKGQVDEQQRLQNKVCGCAFVPGG